MIMRMIGRGAPRRIARQHAHEEGREPCQDGHEEGVLAADEVAQHTEHERAEGADQEARGEGQQREDVARGFRKAVKNCAPMNAASEP